MLIDRVACHIRPRLAHLVVLPATFGPYLPSKVTSWILHTNYFRHIGLHTNYFRPQMGGITTDVAVGRSSTLLATGCKAVVVSVLVFIT